MKKIYFLTALLLGIIWIISPADAALVVPYCISPKNEASVDTMKTNFVWETNKNQGEFVTYHLLVSTKADFSDSIVNLKKLYEKNQYLSLKPKTKFYWKVRSVYYGDHWGPYEDYYPLQDSSDWSQPFTLTTSELLNYNKDSVRLLLPENGDVLSQTYVTFTWEYAIHNNVPISLHLMVFLDSACTDTVNNVSIYSNRFNCNLQLNPQTKYYWKGRLEYIFLDEVADSSRWSQLRSFTTGTYYHEATKLLSPVNDTINQPEVPYFSWVPMKDGSNYQLQVSVSPAFDNCIIDDTNLTASTVLSPVNLEIKTKYFWRVRLHHMTYYYGEFWIGNQSPWSEVFSFSTLDTPEIPPLYKPQNGKTGVALFANLIWKTSEFAKSYTVEVSKDSSSFDQPAYYEEVPGLALSNQNPYQSTRTNELEPNTVYYWHVKSNCPISSSAWSPVWSFTTSTSEVKDDAAALRIFPQPAGNLIFVNLKTLNLSGKISAEIFSMCGVKLLSIKELELNNSGIAEISLSGLSSGIYLLRISSAGVSNTYRFLKN